jgi:glycosyltransferase involved in cell wall biosynthesis
VTILYAAIDTPIPGTHGGSVHALELCRALSRRGHDLHILAPAGRPTAPHGPRGEVASAALPGDRVWLHRLARPPRFLEWSAVGKVRRLARAVAPDVIVERFYTFGGAGIWAAHDLGLPAVLEVNSPARAFPGSWRDRIDRLSVVRPVDRWRRRVLRWSDAVYATSKHLVPPELQPDVTVVTNGVDTQRFKPMRQSRADGPLRCAYVSSFRSWHGAEDLVEAVRICDRKGIPLQVTCLGHGPRWAAARAAATRAGLVDTLQFIGEVAYDQVPGYLADADVGLAPFSPDAFSALQLGWFWSPIKIFEYLAAGLAVVTVDIPELRDLLPGAVARFYRAGQPAALADELEWLSSNRTRLEDSRQAARSLAESRYTWDHQAAVVETLLQDVVARRRGIER